METKKQRPVHQIVIPFGGSLLKAAIWCHSREGKRPQFSVSFSRTHRGKEAGKWVSVSFYNRDDCLGLSAISTAAYSWMIANNGKGDTNE